MSSELTVAKESSVKQESKAPEENLQPGRSYAPNVEIRETDDALWLWADLPGVDEDSVDVRLEKGVLQIQADVKADDYADLTPVYTEYNVGSFRRIFRISTAIDSAQIDATMCNGVLELQLPKAAEARPRQIPVTVQ